MRLSKPKSEDCPAEATQPFMRLRATPILSLSLVWLLAVVGGHAQEAAPSTSQLKAAFLYNFAKFVEWPPAAFGETNSPIVIGILGEDPIRGDLERAIVGKTINNRPLEIKPFRSAADATNCHLLYIGASEKAHLKQILESLRGASVLTVGETDDFLQKGGMINFIVEKGKYRFQIKEDAAKSVHLKISSKLLSLASHTTR
jgi:hypothetical protein